MISQYPDKVDISQLPLAPPPPGVIPNPAHRESRAYQVYTISAVGLALMLLFVSIRIYAKLVVQKSRGWDDCR